jgi:hypothetical protein
MRRQTDMSRRDWFRLRLPQQSQRLGAAETETSASPGLRAIEKPPNHDGMNLDDLPPLREASLSRAEVAALFDDIQSQASDVQLMQRRGASKTRADVNAQATLAAAKEAFLGGNVKRLQIRYRWQDALWIDTLEQQGSATRLVRISHQGM